MRSRVHYLRDGNLWPSCGTSHDRLVTDDLAEVTCLNCKAALEYRLAMTANPAIPAYVAWVAAGKPGPEPEQLALVERPEVELASRLDRRR